jgi:hypothetical protein
MKPQEVSEPIGIRKKDSVCCTPESVNGGILDAETVYGKGDNDGVGYCEYCRQSHPPTSRRLLHPPKPLARCGPFARGRPLFPMSPTRPRRHCSFHFTHPIPMHPCDGYPAKTRPFPMARAIDPLHSKAMGAPDRSFPTGHAPSRSPINLTTGIQSCRLASSSSRRSGDIDVNHTPDPRSHRDSDLFGAVPS